MTRPPPLYPTRRLTAIVATIALLSIAVAGLTFVVVTQDLTLNALKDRVSASDSHRTRDINSLRESDLQLRQVLLAALNASLAEIHRLQVLVRRLGGNPGSFPTSARTSSFEQPQPQPAPSGGSRASPTPSRSPAPRPSHSPAPSPSPSSSRSCVLPPPAPCVPKGR